MTILRESKTIETEVDTHGVTRLVVEVDYEETLDPEPFIPTRHFDITLVYIQTCEWRDENYELAKRVENIWGREAWALLEELGLDEEWVVNQLI